MPAKHLARVVWAIVAELDVSAAEARYSSLGRHGYAPRHLLAVWVYASMVGMHYASVLARALKGTLPGRKGDAWAKGKRQRGQTLDRGRLPGLFTARSLLYPWPQVPHLHGQPRFRESAE